MIAAQETLHDAYDALAAAADHLTGAIGCRIEGHPWGGDVEEARASYLAARAAFDAAVVDALGAER